MRSRAVVVMAVLSSSLVTGGWLIQRGVQGTGASSTSRARLFDNVMQHITRFYVDSIGQSDLYGKAVDGMLQELRDPHTVFLKAERLSRLTENTTGNYGGLGIQIDVRDGWITVITPLPGTPAERAGVETGDRIVEIAGKSTKGLTPDEARNSLRGRPGTSVTITIERPGNPTRIPFTLVRQEIHRSAVQRGTMLRDGVGYVDVDVFSDSTELELRRAIDSLVAGGMKSLVLDLRGNPGGLLTQGVGVSDLFLDGGAPIVNMRGRLPEANRNFVDATPQPWPQLPVVVLINQGSASASEIVAGALQDHDRAVIVGRTSYGKGSAQTLYPIGMSGALKLTTARWYTPVGRSISKPTDEGDDEDDASADPEGGPEPKRTPYKTQSGRTVYGGGGIVPDVVAGDTAALPVDAAFQAALGQKVPQFRDALTDYAISLKTTRAVASPSFEVTPAMRDALWQRMAQRGITMDRAVYDSASALVSGLLSYEIARYAFGPKAESARVLADDPVIKAALELATGVRDTKELISRAIAKAPPPPKGGE